MTASFERRATRKSAERTAAVGHLLNAWVILRQPARLARALALVAALAPLAARAQDRPISSIPVPTPVPMPTVSASPLPYPAYGTPAPDVQLLIPRKGVPPHVSLTQAIDIAVAASPTFASQRAVYRAIRARYTAEQQALFPSISATGSWEKSYGFSSFGSSGKGGGAPVLSSSIFTTESAGYTVSQLIFDGGRVIAAIKSAKESDIAGRGTLLRQLDTLAFDVAQAYYAVLQDKATVSADQQLVTEFATEENSVRAQIRNGVAALSNLAQAEYQTAKARGQLITAQGQTIAAQSQFATLLGLDADTQIVPEALGPDTNVTMATYAKSLQQALLLRPDYQAAQHTVAADRDNLRYAVLARVPTITGTWNDSTSREFPVLPNWSPQRSLGASISIPIYDQGQTWYTIEVAKYTLAEAQAALEQTRLQIGSDVRSALAQLISARATFVQAQSELSSAQVAMQAARASYRVGVNTILDLVTAEANLATAQSDYITALYAVRTAEQNYLYATGLSDLHV